MLVVSSRFFEGRLAVTVLGRVAASCIVYLCCSALALAAPAEDPLLSLLAGEFALQEGATDEAAERYVAAAEHSADPRLAERATRLALMAGRTELASRGLSQWRQLNPEAVALPQLELALALAEGDANAARMAMAQLAQRPEGWRATLQVLSADASSLLARSLLVELLAQESTLSALDALLAGGSLAERFGLNEVAQRVAELAIQRHAESARAWLWHAEAARKRKDLALARQSVATALALPGLSGDMRMAAAGMLSALGDPAAAAGALAQGEQTYAVLAGRAAFLARAEDDDGLAQLYLELQSLPGPHPPERNYLLGQLAELLQRDEEARAWYQAVPPGEEGDQALLRIAVLDEGLGQLESAVSALRKLQLSDSDNGRLLIDAFVLEAELLIKNKRFDEAMDAYARGLAMFEDDATLLYARALQSERMDRIDQAEKDLRRILALDPESPDALNALGYTLADRTDRLDEAHGLIRRALQKQPENPAIIDSMGWVLFRMGRVDEALPHLRRAFELQRDAEVAAHLGEALWAADKHDEARSIWRLGVEIDAENRAIQRVLERYPSTP